jgi:hypothetical protein
VQDDLYFLGFSHLGSFAPDAERGACAAAAAVSPPCRNSCIQRTILTACWQTWRVAAYQPLVWHVALGGRTAKGNETHTSCAPCTDGPSTCCCAAGAPFEADAAAARCLLRPVAGGWRSRGGGGPCSGKRNLSCKRTQSCTVQPLVRDDIDRPQVRIHCNQADAHSSMLQSGRRSLEHCLWVPARPALLLHRW